MNYYEVGRQVAMVKQAGLAELRPMLRRAGSSLASLGKKIGKKYSKKKFKNFFDTYFTPTPPVNGDTQ